jgi:hypothetical protein
MAEESSWDQANMPQKLGMAWRNRKKISQIIKDCFHLPFFHLIILCLTVTCQIGALGVRVAIICQVVQALVYILAVALPNIPVAVRTDAPAIQRFSCFKHKIKNL